MEEKIIDILVEMLGLTTEQKNDIKNANLFEYGLDSLKVIELIVQLEAAFGIFIDDDDLLINNFGSISDICVMINKYLEAQ